MLLHPIRTVSDVAGSLERSLAGITGVSDAAVTTSGRMITVCARVTEAGRPDFDAAIAEYKQSGFPFTIDRRKH